jgi:UDP-N-acetylmuramate dehydrogenase
MNISENFSLKKYNSFGIDVLAKKFATFTSTETLAEILANNTDEKLILGGGSNILFTKNFAGLVLKNEIDGIEIINETEEHIYLKAGAGVAWHDFVLYCIQNNFAGAENLSLIPGSVGASPMQNIGAYGVELKDIFYSLEAYHIADKKVVQFTNSDCAFGYRESVFKNIHKNEFIILNVTFCLNKKPSYNTSYGAIENELEKMNVQTKSIKAISDAVINIRNSKLPNPAVIGNAGSFFKNPTIANTKFATLKNKYENIVGYPVGTTHTKVAAGWLIEQCGWKGYRKDDAGCHEKQALVLVNYGNANGTEIVQLSNEIIVSVQEKFSIELHREVNVI